MIVDGNEIKGILERVKRESREEIDRLRGEVCQLMEENHRYSRDVDRLMRDNSEFKEQLSENTRRNEASRVDF